MNLEEKKEFTKDFFNRARKAGVTFEKDGDYIKVTSPMSNELLMDFASNNIHKPTLIMCQAKDRSSIISYELSDEEKAKLEELWKSGISDLNVLVKEIWGEFLPNGKLRDGRSREGRSARAYLASKEFNYNTNVIEKLPELVLDEEQKEFIKEFWRKKKSIDIARELFNDPELIPVTQEARVVDDFIENLRNELGDSELSDEIKNMESVPLGKLSSYRPPTNITQLLSRINRYLSLGWEAHSLKKDEMVCCQALKRYMSTFSFVRNIDNYKTEENRMIFEDRFIRYCYNKPDLSHEDLDLYVLLCAERVNIEETAKRLEEVRFDAAQERETNGRISQATSDLISATQTAYNSGCKREEDYLKALTTQRSKRLEQQKNQGQISIINLVKAFQDEKFRQKQLRLGLIEKERITEEAQKIGAMSDMMAAVRGISLEELLSDDEL